MNITDCVKKSKVIFGGKKYNVGLHKGKPEWTYLIEFAAALSYQAIAHGNEH